MAMSSNAVFAKPKFRKRLDHCGVDALVLKIGCGHESSNILPQPLAVAAYNGQAANLKSSEIMQLIDNNGKVIGTPSAPDAQADGFAACTWSTSC